MVTQCMTVPVGLMGNATRAMRFIAAIKPNAFSVGEKGISLPCFFHLWPSSVLRGCNSEKTTLIFLGQLEGLARASSRTQADCMFKMPFERSLKSAFC